MTLFFLLSPIMLYRMIEHQALVAHWVILAGFLLYFSPFEKRLTGWWLLLNALALLIHAYLAVMTFIIWLAFLYQHTVMTQHLRYRQCIQQLALQSLTLVLCAWLSGYFILPLSSIRDPNTYHLLSMDLIDPFVAPNDKLMTQSHEGFNYFGLGMLVILGISLIGLFKPLSNKTPVRRIVPLMTVCSLMAGFAMSHRLAGLVPLFSDVFRASGRFFWPLYYLLMLLALTQLCQQVKTQYLIPLLYGALSLQWVDVIHKFMDFHQRYKSPLITHHIVDRRFFNHMTEQYHRIVFLPNMPSPSRQIKGFSEYAHYAASHHMTINQGYFARENARGQYQQNKALETKAYHGLFSSDSVYVILERNLGELMKARLGKAGDVIKTNKYIIIFPVNTV